jgi:hypothetical protein
MKSFTLVLLALALSISSAFGQTESEVRSQIAGTWKLVSTEQTLKDGTTRPYPEYGVNGKGFLMYQRDGYMCADLVNPDRRKWVSDGHPTSEEKLAAGGSTFAYCGRYEIDVRNKQIIHLPEAATDPAYVGSRQIRPYTFQDGRLILSDAEKNDPIVARWKIVWKKVQ